MKSLVWGIVLGALFFTQTSWAGGYLYESTFLNMGRNYLQLLGGKSTDSLANLAPDKKIKCLQRYSPILTDGVIDIRIALGYFDWTTGTDVYVEGRPFGVSPSLDIGAYYSLKDLLLTPCYGKARFCGFRQDGNSAYRFYRDVQIHGQTYRAQVEVHFSSATEYLDQNQKSYRSEQQRRSGFAETFFVKGLQNADAVFYFGHSRNGGGPDFSPPVFVSGRNKVNYDGYYKPKQPGFKKMASALKSEKKTPILGLMSCASRDHFLSRLRKLAPGTGVITSLDVLNVDEVYTAMIGGVDAILRGQCQQSFYQSLRMTKNNQKYITMDGMFE